MTDALTVLLPPEALEAIAERAAELVLEQLDQAPAESPFLSVDEAAAFLRCSRQRVYELRSSGALTAYKDGDRALVMRSELEQHVSLDRRLLRSARS